MAARLINARAETVSEKPAFRAAFGRRRCLVLSDGYFEWTKAGKYKQPYYIRLSAEQPFAFAGLWESWRDPITDQTLESCTIITTTANQQTRPIHHRMPVILRPADYDRWMDLAVQDRGELAQMLVPYDSDAMRADPVERYVNSPKNDDPRCIRIVQQLF